MVPSKFQQAIYKAFQHTGKDLNISAVAGSGKTTTLLELLKLVPEDKTALFLAFNKSIVEELKNRCERRNVRICTLHSLGYSLLNTAYGTCKIKNGKAVEVVKKLLGQNKVPEKLWGRYIYNVYAAVNLVRCNLFTPDEEGVDAVCERYDVDLDETGLYIFIKTFKKCEAMKNEIDFMDMIYRPVTDPRVRFRKYDYVFCDESQDFSVCQHEFIRNCISRNGRLITVGDENQAIYGFTGADADSYRKLATLRGASIRLPLSVSYRCAEEIIHEAQKYVPSIQAAPGAKSGSVKYGNITDIQDGDWVLCRNLKPLIQLYFWLLENHMKCHVRGREIAENLVGFINTVGGITLDGLVRNIEIEKEKVVRRLQARGIKNTQHHPRIATIEERREVIEVLSKQVRNVPELKNLINGIFSDETSSGILLSTIHKAKGLENERVFFICPELIPSKYAKQEWELTQEMNLKYVAITRAKEELVYVPKELFDKEISGVK